MVCYHKRGNVWRLNKPRWGTQVKVITTVWTGAAVRPGQSCVWRLFRHTVQRSWSIWSVTGSGYWGFYIWRNAAMRVQLAAWVGLLILYVEQKQGLLGREGGKLTPALMCSHHVCDHPAAVWSTKPPCCLGNRPVQTLVVRTRLFRISLLYRWWVVLILFFRLSLSLWVALVLKHIVPIRIDS